MYDPHVLLTVNNTAENTNLFFLDRLFSYVATQTVVAIHRSTCTVNSTTANPQAPQVWHAFSLGGQRYQHLSIATLGRSWHQVFMEALGKKKVQKLSAPLPLGTKISGQIFKSAQKYTSNWEIWESQKLSLVLYNTKYKSLNTPPTQVCILSWSHIGFYFFGREVERCEEM